MSTPIFERFVRRWVEAPSPSPLAAEKLSGIEGRLSITWPTSFRRFVVEYGTPFTPGLLGAIVDGRHEIEDLQEFLELDEIVTTTQLYESGGMESGFVGFAMDCAGNLFMFRRSDCVADAEDAPVWFFDHDFVSVERVCNSFNEWLLRFTEIEASPRSR